MTVELQLTIDRTVELQVYRETKFADQVHIQRQTESPVVIDQQLDFCLSLG